MCAGSRLHLLLFLLELLDARQVSANWGKEVEKKTVASLGALPPCSAMWNAFRVHSPAGLPVPITSVSPGTWAYDTMTRRVLKDVFPRILADNLEKFDDQSTPTKSELISRLDELAANLAKGTRGKLRYIEDEGVDTNTWRDILDEIPEHHRNWLQAPWIVAEFYFFRRVAEAFDYFKTKYDFFQVQKQAGLLDAMPAIAELADRLPTILASSDRAAVTRCALLVSLWGNKLDLSLWPKTGKPSNNVSIDTVNPTCAGQVTSMDYLDAMDVFVLDNHMDQVVEFLLTQSGGRVDIIVDNAGYELVSDLFLAACLLSLNLASTVVLHTKAYPTFVSDATTKDVMESIQALFSSSCGNTAAFGARLLELVKQGDLVVLDDPFWCQPYAFWSMPEHIYTRLASSTLVIVKGDANYRRMLGDRQWELNMTAKEVFSYWHVPVCALRIMKAEVACGLTVSQQIVAIERDPTYLVSGRWAVVQFFSPSPL